MAGRCHGSIEGGECSWGETCLSTIWHHLDQHQPREAQGRDRAMAGSFFVLLSRPEATVRQSEISGWVYTAQVTETSCARHRLAARQVFAASS